ncbi:MAG: helix-turn-helix domain-containing protein [Opitutaceae bacterium]|nr:helix-turn-helix domain-containing protein [Opitutaceae bacterium]
MNRLEVSLQQAIQALHERGWSQRRIARELSVNRETVAGYVHALNPAISTPG